jgi:hypothetical protein
MHEMVRRQRWNFAHKGISTPAGALMFFEKDCTGSTPYMKLLERAPFDIILNFSLLLPEIRDEVIEE